MAQNKRLGIAVVGSGRIGTMRARAALTHPSIDFVAVSDLKRDNAARLADKVGAHAHSGNNNEIIRHPAVNTVIVSTAKGSISRRCWKRYGSARPC